MLTQMPPQAVTDLLVISLLATTFSEEVYREVIAEALGTEHPWYELWYVFQKGAENDDAAMLHFTQFLDELSPEVDQSLPEDLSLE